MRFRHVHTNIIALFLIIDLVMGVAASTTWLAYLEVRDMRGTAALCTAMLVVHTLLWLATLPTSTAALRVWERAGASCSDAELLAADRCVTRLPLHFGVVTSVSWAAYFVGVFTLTWFVFPELIELGQLELQGLAFQLVALACGPMVVTISLVGLLVQTRQLEIGVELDARDLTDSRDEVALSLRTSAIALFILMASHAWAASTTWIAAGESARALTSEHLRGAVTLSARSLDAGDLAIDQPA